MAQPLEKAYAVLNRRYFGHRLPRVAVRWSRLLDRRQFGDFLWDAVLYRAAKGKDRRYAVSGVIRLAPWMKSRWQVWRMTLLHEMAHVAVRDRRDEQEPGVDKHSRSWHQEMRRLARAGAFDELW